MSYCGWFFEVSGRQAPGAYGRLFGPRVLYDAHFTNFADSGRLVTLFIADDHDDERLLRLLERSRRNFRITVHDRVLHKYFDDCALEGSSYYAENYESNESPWVVRFVWLYWRRSFFDNGQRSVGSTVCWKDGF